MQPYTTGQCNFNSGQVVSIHSYLIEIQAIQDSVLIDQACTSGVGITTRLGTSYDNAKPV
jgi:hypothetical protein